MEKTDVFSLDGEYIASTYARFGVNIVSGKGSILKGGDGKEYIDLGAGIATNVFGACDDTWIRAVTDQLAKIQHASNLYYTDPGPRLARLLCEKTGMKKVFFCNSGAEANECAIKTARKWAAEHLGAEYHTVVTLKNSFHGRTLATLAATGQDVFHRDFLPLTPGFAYAEPNDSADLERVMEENKCAALLIETVQGEGGVNVLTDSFVADAAALTKKYGALLMVDEVQTGNGRCGAMYSYMNYGIAPDVVSTAKGLGGGLPIGATMFGERTADVLTPGTHGSTFGGNPVCCAGAESVVSRLDEDLFAAVRKKSEMIFEKLSGKPGITGVHGRGLMIGADVTGDVKAVVKGCIERGALVLSAKNRVRLTPALNIPEDVLSRGLDIVAEAAAEAAEA
ncbi:MAG: aminotransferase class III-fold pyridoxal phosphate-dependent enzyme [Clostridia bacterium]|nr:aminotransferase class III-fold pyridoxal phosphate-dependent enzyme [Clostridia bacterium]